MGFTKPTVFPSHIVASAGGLFLAMQAPIPPGLPETSPETCWPLMLLAALFGGFVVWIIDKRKRVE